MTIDRRDFLVRTAQAAGFLTIGRIAEADEVKKFEDTSFSADEYQGLLPIAQCMTDATSALFVIMLPKGNNYSVKAFGKNRTELGINFLRLEIRSHNKWAVQQIRVENLNLSEEYTLQVLDGKSGKVVDERIFKALNPYKPSAKYAVASCMNDWFSGLRVDMWQAMAATNPDFILIAGDSVYADFSNSDRDEKGYWERWTVSRERLAIFRMKKLIPIFSTWDDHDFGLNNANKNFKQKNLTKDIFGLFWGDQSTASLSLGPGVSKVLNVAGQRIFLMDDRFFRDEDGRGSHWGVEQENFLISEIAKSKAPAFIWNGSQFFGGYLGKESYEGNHPQSLKQIIRELRKLDAPVAFGSGDVHFSETMLLEPDLLGYKSLEFTSSAIHSFAFPGMWFRKKNSRRRASTSSPNFLLVESSYDLTSTHWRIKAQSIGRNKAVLFRHEQVIRR